MSEKIKLKVPAKTGVDSVSIGNYTAELKPGKTIETESREFADYLIRQHGLTEETTVEKTEPKKDDGGKE